MLSDQESDLLLKTRLPTFGDEYKNDDVEQVVKHYCAYLSACAEHTTRLSKMQGQIEQDIIEYIIASTGV